MKRAFVLFLFLFLCVSVWAQDENVGIPEKSTSKAVEFMSKDGALLHKEFFDLGTVKGVKCDAVIITDIVSGEKIGCMRIVTNYQKTPHQYVGTLDYDELEACIQSMNYIIGELLPSNPDNYIEVEYHSRDYVRIGAFYNENTN